MNRKFLTMVATICGLVMVVSLLVLPATTWGKGDHSGSARVISMPIGGFLLLSAWIAAAFAALSTFGKTHIVGMSDEKHCAVSFLGFKLAGLFLIAVLIQGAGGEDVSWGVGFWFALLADIVGVLALYLTFNPALAKKIADAAKSDDDSGGDD